MSRTSATPLDALKLLLQQCRDNAIPLVRIRPRELSEEVAYDGGDYDYLVAPDKKDALLRLIHKTFSASAIPFLLDQRKRDKTVLRLYETNGGGTIILDIWEHLEWRTPEQRGIRYIEWSDIEKHISKDKTGYRFDARFEAAYYLIHLQTKRKQLDNPEVAARLQHYQEHIAAEETLAQLFGSLQQQGLKASAKAAGTYLESLGVSAEKTTRATAGARFYKSRMRYHGRGNLVAFIGPDGVGKTTIIREYKQLLAGKVKYYRFKKLFRNALLYKLVLPLLRVIAERSHREKLEKNQVDDRFGGVLFLIARLRFPTISLRRFWNTTLLCDRYFHDFLFEGLRFIEERPRLRPGTELLRKLIPPPRTLIQLDAANEVIVERKAELSDIAIDFYRAEVFETQLRKPAPYYLYINTGNPLESCIEALKLASRDVGLELYRFSEHKEVTNQTGVVDLSTATELGKGHERTCYLDPRDEHHCIKVSRYRDGDRQQNRIEYRYLKTLAGRGVPLDYMAKCHGWVETSAGKGLVFDSITDAEGKPARSLASALKRREIDRDAATALLSELYLYLYANAVVFADISLDNVLLGTTPEGNRRLFIIDGLGARRYGLKLWLHSHLTWLARRKLKKQWQALLQKQRELDA